MQTHLLPSLNPVQININHYLLKLQELQYVLLPKLMKQEIVCWHKSLVSMEDFLLFFLITEDFLLQCILIL